MDWFCSFLFSEGNFKGYLLPGETSALPLGTGRTGWIVSCLRKLFLLSLLLASKEVVARSWTGAFSKPLPVFVACYLEFESLEFILADAIIDWSSFIKSEVPSTPQVSVSSAVSNQLSLLFIGGSSLRLIVYTSRGDNSRPTVVDTEVPGIF